MRSGDDHRSGCGSSPDQERQKFLLGSTLHAVPLILEAKKLASGISERLPNPTYHSARFIPRVDRLRQRQDASDPRQSSGPGIPGGIHVVELSDQLQLHSSVPDDLGPNLDIHD